MSFDIYGHNLRPGHCEVHPHVHEEYPCTLCDIETRKPVQPAPTDNRLYPDDPLNDFPHLSACLQSVASHGAGGDWRAWSEIVCWCRKAAPALNDALHVLNAHAVGYKTQEWLEKVINGAKKGDE